MKTRSVYKSCDITSTSCLINDCIYFVQKHKLLKFDIYANKTTAIKENFQSQDLQSTSKDILSLNNNIVTVFNTQGDILREFTLSFIPKITKKINNIIYFLGSNEFCYYKDKLETIRVLNVNKSEFFDFCKDDDNFYFLTNENRVYECKDVIETGRVLLNKIIPFVKEDKKIKRLGCYNNTFFAAFENSVTAFIKKDNMFIPIYIYQSDKKQIKVNFDSKPFVIAEELFFLDKYPIKIINDKVIFILENLAICDEKIVVIDDDRVLFKEANFLPLLKETDVNERVDKLFELYNYSDTGFYKDDEENVNLLKQEIHAYKCKYLDRLESMYIELNAINESFLPIFEELNEEACKIKEKQMDLNNKKIMLLDKLKDVYTTLSNYKNHENYNGDINFYNFRMKKIKDLLKECTLFNEEETLKVLKNQNMMLKTFLN
ncbi:hypothetical protein COBT_000359 [Conglomerata obtusa]